MKFSNAIQYKLTYLKLTRAGKIRLSVFSDKVIHKAHDALFQQYEKIPRNPYSTLYGYCYHMTDILNIQPQWGKISEFKGFDDTAAVTEYNEKFNNKMAAFVKEDLKRRKKTSSKQQFTSKSRSSGSNQGVTFSKGLTYWKHGKEYPYPDQAIDPDDADDNIELCKKDEAYDRDEKWTQNDPRRKNLDPVKELQKALKTGRVNMKGLKEIYIGYKGLCPPVYELLTYYFKTWLKKHEMKNILSL